MRLRQIEASKGACADGICAIVAFSAAFASFLLAAVALEDIVRKQGIHCRFMDVDGACSVERFSWPTDRKWPIVREPYSRMRGN